MDENQRFSLYKILNMHDSIPNAQNQNQIQKHFLIRLKKAYKFILSQHHPELNTSAESKRIFALASTAYHTLSNKDRKQAYDLNNTIEKIDPIEILQAYQNEANPKAANLPDFLKEESMFNRLESDPGLFYQANEQFIKLLKDKDGGSVNMFGSVLAESINKRLELQKSQMNQSNQNQQISKNSKSPGNQSESSASVKRPTSKELTFRRLLIRLISSLIVLTCLILFKIYTNSFPNYKFRRSGEFSIEYKTSRNKVVFYANRSYADKYNSYGISKRAKIERRIEADYSLHLESQCNQVKTHYEELGSKINSIRNNKALKSSLLQKRSKVDFSICEDYRLFKEKFASSTV